MHHAYPRECPYPHLSGTTSPVTAEKFQDRNGVSTLCAVDASCLPSRVPLSTSLRHNESCYSREIPRPQWCKYSLRSGCIMLTLASALIHISQAQRVLLQP